MASTEVRFCCMPLIRNAASCVTINGVYAKGIMVTDYYSSAPALKSVLRQKQTLSGVFKAHPDLALSALREPSAPNAVPFEVLTFMDLVRLANLNADSSEVRRLQNRLSRMGGWSKAFEVAAFLHDLAENDSSLRSFAEPLLTIAEALPHSHLILFDSRSALFETLLRDGLAFEQLEGSLGIDIER